MCTRHVTQSQLIEKYLQAIKLVWQKSGRNLHEAEKGNHEYES